MADREHFLLAEFAEPDAMLNAASGLRRDGWRVELHSPFPVEGMEEALGFSDNRVPLAALVGGMVGAVVGFGVPSYAALSYPHDVGGRPVIAIPAYAFIMLEFMVLFAVLAAVAMLFRANRLPRLNYPLFDSDRFSSASDDRFFVSVDASGRGVEKAHAALQQFHPVGIDEVGGRVEA